jgi:predicted transcriptional regulator
MKSVRKKKSAPPQKRARGAAAPARSQAKARAVASLPVAESSDAAATRWTFLTNHTHVLVLLARNPSSVLREVAVHVGITERAVQRIIADLESGGIIEREKIGRQNRYRIRTDRPLRHANESRRTIGELLALFSGD